MVAVGRVAEPAVVEPFGCLLQVAVQLLTAFRIYAVEVYYVFNNYLKDYNIFVTCYDKISHR